MQMLVYLRAGTGATASAAVITINDVIVTRWGQGNLMHICQDNICLLFMHFALKHDIS